MMDRTNARWLDCFLCLALAGWAYAGCDEEASPEQPAAPRPSLFEYLPVQENTAPIPAPMEVLTGDFDHDGRQDLAWNYKSGGLCQSYIGFGTTDGKFRFRPASTSGRQIPEGWENYRTLAGQFDAGGISDLAWNWGATRNRTYFGLSDGVGGIDYAPLMERDEGGWFGFVVLALDINGDGIDDLAWNETSPTGNRTFVGINRIYGILNMLPGSQDYPAGDWSASRAATGDVTGEGRGDLIWNALSSDANRFALGLGRADGRFDLVTERRRSGSENWSDFELHVGDVNGDRRDDLVWVDARHTRSRIYVSLAAGDSTFTDQPAQEAPVDLALPFVTRLGDFDGDGRADLVWNELGTQNRIQVGLAQAAGRFDFSPAVQAQPANADWTSFLLVVADIDGDGRDDLVWNHPDVANTIYVARARSIQP
jgi:hypothetical protein